MIYKLNFSDGVVEFVKNRGRTFLEAADPASALGAARELFEHTRDEKVQSLGSGQYLVTFKVSLDYRLPFIRMIEKAIKLLRSRDIYADGRFVDRYVVATIFMERGHPDFLNNVDIKNEISSLRKASVVAREVANVMSFIDIDIGIYNYLELNNKDGFKSRVVRKVPV